MELLGHLQKDKIDPQSMIPSSTSWVCHWNFVPNHKILPPSLYKRLQDIPNILLGQMPSRNIPTLHALKRFPHILHRFRFDSRLHQEHYNLPHEDSFLLTWWGALSVPMKNFELPPWIASINRFRCVSRFNTGKQYLCGRSPPSKMANRVNPSILLCIL